MSQLPDSASSAFPLFCGSTHKHRHACMGASGRISTTIGRNVKKNGHLLPWPLAHLYTQLLTAIKQYLKPKRVNSTLLRMKLFLCEAAHSDDTLDYWPYFDRRLETRFPSSITLNRKPQRLKPFIVGGLLCTFVYCC